MRRGWLFGTEARYGEGLAEEDYDGDGYLEGVVEEVGALHELREENLPRARVVPSASVSAQIAAHPRPRKSPRRSKGSGGHSLAHTFVARHRFHQTDN